jgi:hypothetical protein
MREIGFTSRAAQTGRATSAVAAGVGARALYFRRSCRYRTTTTALSLTETQKVYNYSDAKDKGVRLSLQPASPRLRHR